MGILQFANTHTPNTGPSREVFAQAPFPTHQASWGRRFMELLGRVCSTEVPIEVIFISEAW